MSFPKIEDRTKDDWLLLAKNRAERLARLIDLNAFESIIESEVAMLEEAIEGWRKVSKHDWLEFRRQRKEQQRQSPASREELVEWGLTDDEINKVMGH